MGYIVTLKKRLSEEEVKKIIDGDVFISKVLPIIIVDNISKKLEGSVYVESIREEETGELQAISIIPCINEYELKNRNLFGFGINIAIIDSGVDKTKVKKVVNEINCIHYNDNNTNDLFGHGTVVATIINQCAPGANITSLKITDSKQFNEGNLIKALEQAYQDSSINIVNLSLSLGRFDCEGECIVCQMVKLLCQQGKIVVTAAGNGGPINGTIGCPGSVEEAITVGAVDYNCKIAEYSSRGKKGQKKPNLVTSGQNDYIDSRFNAGTSFATPVVSGVCACIFNDVLKDVNRLKEVLYDSTIPLKNIEVNYQGHGVLNIKKLLEVLDNEKIHSESL